MDIFEHDVYELGLSGYDITKTITQSMRDAEKRRIALEKENKKTEKRNQKMAEQMLKAELRDAEKRRIALEKENKMKYIGSS